MTPAIATARAEDAAEITDLIATAFNGLDVSRWLVTDRQERYHAQFGQFALVIEHALEHGTAYLTHDRSATAVWVDRTHPIPEPQDYDRRLRTVCGRHTERFAVLDQAFAAHHPQAGHQHLAFVAVHPSRQQQGIGTALLEHHHAKLDRAGVPAYLEASDARTRDLYAAHGYRVISVIDLPDGPSMWPMWRDPGRAGGAAGHFM